MIISSAPEYSNSKEISRSKGSNANLTNAKESHLPATSAGLTDKSLGKKVSTGKSVNEG